VSQAKEIIACSKYAEFPDVLTTLELCRIFALREKRRVGESLRGCARILAVRVDDERLRATLEEMGKSQFPEVQIVRLRDCLRRVESALIRRFPLGK
jgi:hypothetical protein